MFKHNSLLSTVNLVANCEKIIDLGMIMPLGKVECPCLYQVSISYNGHDYMDLEIKGDFNNKTARYLKVKAQKDSTFSIYCGLGYLAYRRDDITSLFLRKHGWSGADGIYSFNLDESENYSQMQDKTLFIFGDTFAGQVEASGRRIEPTAMVNNTLAYYKNGEVDFRVNKKEDGAYSSMFSMPKTLRQVGYLAGNLVDYNKENKLPPFISALDPKKDVELVFDLHGVHQVTDLQLENFHQEPDFGLPQSNRGAKKILIYVSKDVNDYRLLSVFTIDKYSLEKPVSTIRINCDFRFMKLVFPLGDSFNYGGLDKKDLSVGLKKVMFFTKEGQLYDVSVSSNSEFNYKEVKSWFWLQDGIVVKNKFYVFPLMVEEDLTGVEGFEFKITGTCSLCCCINEKELDISSASIRRIPLYNVDGDKEFTFPSAILNNTKVDGYVYFYGFYNQRSKFLRNMIVSRIKEDQLDDLNNLRFFDGSNWVTDMTESKSLLTHVSCEMSVQPLTEGENKGKYLAVFQYDSASPYVCYSIGDSLTGPFTEPNIVYVCPEVEELYKGTTYTYNAKAHYHLSTPKKILVTYNTNDTSMENNKADYRIYHPRFIELMDNSDE